MSTAIVPVRGTIYDHRGTVVSDPRLARLDAMFGMTGGYRGARSDLRSMQDWSPLPTSADADSIGDLPTLRARSRDLARNAPLAAGAINTVITNAIGTGLTPHPRVDVEYLSERYGVTDEQADAFERAAARLWRHHSEGRYFDIAGLETHPQLQVKVLRGVLESGDILVQRRQKAGRPGALFGHCVALIEADRVANPLGEIDRPGFAAGVETDEDGTPIRYHVASRHPLDSSAWEPIRWHQIPARGPVSGERMVRHLAQRRRARQSRGVPYLAVVIEPLKQLDRYGEAELMAAVVASMFTVFIKTEYPGDFLPHLDTASAEQLLPTSVGLDVPVPRKVKLASGGVVQLRPGEDVTTADTKRPNALYDPFVASKLAEIGTSLEIPVELLTKRFQSSYSASRASRLEFWKFVAPIRAFVAADFCQPDYEDLLSEAVALGYLDAPGFFEDPLARQAWSGCWWVGPAPGQIDEKGEVDAAIARVEAGLSTLEAETASLTGGSWEQNHRQQVKELRKRQADGLQSENVGGRASTAKAVSPDKRIEERDARDREEALSHA